MIKANYHTHTTRCHHAQGTDESYVEAAIRAGYDVLGFSDHPPWPFRSGYVSRIRMLPDDLRGYIDSVHLLQKQYEGRLTIHLGLEAEYFPDYADHLRRLFDQGVEYLILGQHYLGSEEYSPYAGSDKLGDEGVLRYGEAVVQGIRSGLFAYVAHPDLTMRMRREDQFNAACMEAADMICQAAAEAGIPLEYNLLGLALQISGNGCGYPSRAFWDYVKRWNPRVILGVDAHRPSLLESGYLWMRGVDTLQRMGFERVESLPLASD